MSLQKDHEAIRNHSHSLTISVVAENIRTPENLGMIMRVCEAFGVKSLYFVGELGVELSTKAKRASRNTHTYMNYSFQPEGEEVIKDLKKAGYGVVALEITQESKPIHTFSWGRYRKLALLIGSEREGISETLLQEVNEATHINMYGKNSSINVTNALAIALHEIIVSQF